MAYELIGWVLANGERHVLKADATHHPGLEDELLKYDPATTGDGDPPAECCCLCCCNFVCDGGSIATPDPVTATLSGETGDCACLPNSVNMPHTPTACDWNGSAASTCAGNADLVLSLHCPAGGPPCEWTAFAGCGAAPQPMTILSVSCNPFIVEAEATFGPGSCCTGTFHVTFTG